MCWIFLFCLFFRCYNNKASPREKFVKLQQVQNNSAKISSDWRKTFNWSSKKVVNMDLAEKLRRFKKKYDPDPSDIGLIFKDFNVDQVGPKREQNSQFFVANRNLYSRLWNISSPTWILQMLYLPLKCAWMESWRFKVPGQNYSERSWKSYFRKSLKIRKRFSLSSFESFGARTQIDE